MKPAKLVVVIVQLQLVCRYYLHSNYVICHPLIVFFPAIVVIARLATFVSDVIQATHVLSDITEYEMN